MYRLTPRQAVIIIARTANDSKLAPLAGDIGTDRLASLLLATLRDTIAAAVRVDGASIVVVAPDPDTVVHLRQLLPAGLDIVAPAEPVLIDRLDRFALSAHEDRGFERLLVLDGAVLRLTARIIGTGLGALANADAVVGGYRRGSRYAFGLLSRHIPAVIHSGILSVDDHHGVDETQDRLRRLRLGSRRLDPLPATDAFLTLSELRDAIVGRAGLGRHTASELSVSNWADPILYEQPRHTD